MGHTLVAVFSEKSSRDLKMMLKIAGAADACKIPFGRNCDSAAADRILKHHITLYHWGKEEDAVYLKRLSSLHSIPPCKITAVKPVIKYGISNSRIVCLEVAVADDFSKINSTVGRYLQKKPNQSLHITLDVTKNAKRADELCRRLQIMKCLPLELEISGLELYKIWNPVRLVNSYPVVRAGAGSPSNMRK